MAASLPQLNKDQARLCGLLPKTLIQYNVCGPGIPSETLEVPQAILTSL